MSMPALGGKILKTDRFWGGSDPISGQKLDFWPEDGSNPDRNWGNGRFWDSRELSGVLARVGICWPYSNNISFTVLITSTIVEMELLTLVRNAILT